MTGRREACPRLNENQVKSWVMVQFKNYLSIKVLPIWLILIMDIFLTLISVLLSYFMRYDFTDMIYESGTMKSALLIVTVVNIVFFKIFRTYNIVLRLSSFVDIARIFVTLALSYLCVWGLGYILPLIFVNMKYVSEGMILMMFIVNFAFMGFSRIIVKIMYENYKYLKAKNRENIFIYGAKEVGVNIAKGIRLSLDSKYKLKGFIADEADLQGKLIMGVKVYPNDDNLFNVLAENNVQTVIVSPAKYSQLEKGENLNRFADNRIKLLTATPISEIGQRQYTSSDIKEIQIEDLLQRDPIQIDMKTIASHLEGKRVMITGAAGSIGSEIMRQVALFNPYKLILVDQAETPLHDIRLELQDSWRDIDASTIIASIENQSRMEAIFKEFKPQYIFHAAAYKHVPMMEDNVSEAIQNNVAGTKIIADLAVKYGAEKFVMVSTDKAVNPTNVMGCSKRICEIYVQSLAKKLQKEGIKSTQFITTRFGNVLGSNGSVIPRFKDQIKHGGPVTVTHPDIIRYFMTIPEACRLVLEAGSMGNGGEIYIFDMGKPVKILDLAKRMIYLSGRTDVKIEFTGLRHGEKLYEELLNVKELTKPTHHEKIMIANVREYDYDEVNEQIGELIKSSYSYDQMAIVKGMKELVPEFKSKNSEFEVLDK